MALDLGNADIEGVSASTISSIENVKKVTYETRRLLSLCAALGWTADSIERILAGGEPTVVAVPGNHDIDAARHPVLPAGTAAEGLIDVSGLPAEDVEMIEQQVRRLKRLHGIDE